jgi:hypothetical protein
MLNMKEVTICMLPEGVVLLAIALGDPTQIEGVPIRGEGLRGCLIKKLLFRSRPSGDSCRLEALACVWIYLYRLPMDTEDLA